MFQKLALTCTGIWVVSVAASTYHLLAMDSVSAALAFPIYQAMNGFLALLAMILGLAERQGTRLLILTALPVPAQLLVWIIYWATAA